jgi:hypothetical protein
MQRRTTLSILLGILTLIFVSGTVMAQQPATTSAQTSPVDEDEGLSWRLRRYKSALLLDGFINSKPVTFFVDTGSPGSSITPEAVKRLGLKTQPYDPPDDKEHYVEEVSLVCPVIGSPKGSFAMAVYYLHVHEFPLFENCDGVLGLSFFQSFAMRIDYTVPALHFQRRTRIEEPPNALTLEMPKDAAQVFVPVKMNNRHYNLLLDTGFLGNIKFTPFTLDKFRIPDSFPVVTDYPTQTFYGRAQNKLIRFPTISLGKTKPFATFEDVFGLLETAAPKGTPKANVSMIGAGLLQFYDIIFSPGSEKVYLVKNRFHSDSWINMAFGIAVAKEKGARRITAIMPGRPAAMSGAMVGDRVIEVMGVSIAKLEQAGGVMSMLINPQYGFTLKVKSATRDEIYTLHADVDELW